MKDGFEFRKRPWIRFLLLVAAVLWFLQIISVLRDFRITQAADIMSSAAWKEYKALADIRLIVNSGLCVTCAASFLINTFARNQRQAEVADMILLIAWVLGLGALIAVFYADVPAKVLLGGILIWLFAVSAVIYSVVRFVRKRNV